MAPLLRVSGNDPPRRRAASLARMTGSSSLSISESGGRVVVAGEVDTVSVVELAPYLDRLAQGGSVTFDLSGVDFMDSSGLRALIAAHQSASEAGGQMVLGNLSRPVARLFEVAGLSDYFALESDEAGVTPD